MRIRGLVYALCISATAALLAACGGNAGSVAGPPAAETPFAASFSKTFKFTDGVQTFRVPAGVTKLQVVARGAAGGGETCYSYCHGSTYFGRGGRVFAVIPVRPREKLYVFVGGEGSQGNGGFNGGGSGGAYSIAGYGGGGASDVREHGDGLHDRILVAAGGGGQGAGSRFAFGGSGGGNVGGAGGTNNYGTYDYAGGGGTGGTQKGGGAGGTGGVGSSENSGTPGSPGTLGTGGSGGRAGSNPSGLNFSGGGGGGGYYGGGGGGGGGAAFASIYGGPGGGGGGGSSYIEPKASKFQTWSGWKNATTNGLVVFSWQ